MKFLLPMTLIVLLPCFVEAQDIFYKDVTCREAAELIQMKSDESDFCIVDLRPEKMYNEDHIAGAIFIDVFSKDFDNWMTEQDKNKTYLLYCTSGKRSKTAFDKMKEAGFRHLYHMNEGIRTWIEKGYKTVRINSERPKVEKAINDVIGWAVKKDFNLFFGTIADDSNFVSVTPRDRVRFGVNEVKNDTAFWANPDFKAVRHELHNLKINFSRDGRTAWYYCVLDDINTWKGQPANWEKVRWTGVLEKRNGSWRLVQQHFSWPKLN